jgi:thioredoxin 2
MSTATVPCQFCDKLNRVALDRLHALPKCGSCGVPLRLDRPLRVSDSNLDKVVSGTDVPLLVDFHADWCGPCKVMAPVLDEIAAERAGSLVITKLDTDRNPALASRYGIRGIPTVIVFRSGREAAREVGAVPKARLLKLVDELSTEQPLRGPDRAS